MTGFEGLPPSWATKPQAGGVGTLFRGFFFPLEKSDHNFAITEFHLTYRWKLNKSMILAIELQLNPLTPMSDQGRISPYNIDTISNR